MSETIAVIDRAAKVVCEETADGLNVITNRVQTLEAESMAYPDGIGRRRLRSFWTNSAAYSQRVRAAVGSKMIGYWPLSEAAGTTAMDISGNVRNGVYTNVTLGQVGIGDGRTATRFVTTPASKMNPYSAGLDAVDNLNEGAVALWLKPLSADMWADANSYYFIYLSTDFTSGIIGRKVGANSLVIYRRNGAQISTCTIDIPTTARWLHLGFKWSVTAGKVYLYVNGTPKIPVSASMTNLSASLAAAGTVFGSATGASSNWAGDLAHIVWCNALPSNDNFAVLGQTSRQIIFDGDSRTADKNWIGAAVDNAFTSGDFTFGGRGIGSWAISGQTIATILANAPTVIDPLRRGDRDTLFLWAGVNDHLRSAADIYADIAAYCNARRAAGWWKIIVCTEIDAQGAVSASWHTTNYQALNTLLRDNHSFCDALVDLGADARLQDATDLTYYLADQLHLNSAGYAVVAELAAPVIAATA